jgi:hypothetical protein
MRGGAPAGFAMGYGLEEASDPVCPFPDFASFDTAAADFIRWAIKDAHVNPNVGSRNALTPLQFAVSVGAPECVKALIEGGANMHYVSPNGTSVLSDALTVEKGPNHDKILQTLADWGLDPSRPADPSAIESCSPSFTDYHRRCAASRFETNGIRTIGDTVSGRFKRPLSDFEMLRRQADKPVEGS